MGPARLEEARGPGSRAHRQGPAAVKGVDGRLGLGMGLELHEGAAFAGAVWAPEHSALVYGPERLEHLPDVFICLLLP